MNVQRATAHLYFQKAAQAADEAWGTSSARAQLSGPTVADAERTDPTPQEDEDW